MTKEELIYMEEIINEEILEQLKSGCNLYDDYIKILRGILKKLGLKEIYNFDRFDK